MKFVDQLPPDGRRRWAPIDVAELRANPGRWAEAARDPKEKRGRVAIQGRRFAAQHEGVEYTTRAVGDEVVLYVRAVSA